jgi:hypothetical protein
MPTTALLFDFQQYGQSVCHKQKDILDSAIALNKIDKKEELPTRIEMRNYSTNI